MVEAAGECVEVERTRRELTPDTAFKQQRLKAWQPILTPKAVLPTLFIIGIIFAPIGAVIIWGSGKVTSIELDYTNCDTATSQFTTMPEGTWNCELAGWQTILTRRPPQDRTP